MPGLIYFDEIKRALGLPPKARLVTVEKALLRRNLPFEYGEKGVFTTLEAWNSKITGLTFTTTDEEPIEFEK